MSNTRKLRSPRPIALPEPVIDARRVQACVRACAHISTAALESGLVGEVLESHGLLLFSVALAANLSAQGKNPADYLDFAGVARPAAVLGGRLEASGFEEHLNRTWEREHGERLGTGAGVTGLVPLSRRRKAS